MRDYDELMSSTSRKPIYTFFLMMLFTVPLYAVTAYAVILDATSGEPNEHMRTSVGVVGILAAVALIFTITTFRRTPRGTFPHWVARIILILMIISIIVTAVFVFSIGPTLICVNNQIGGTC